MSNVEFDTDMQGNPLYSSKTGSTRPSAPSAWPDGSSATAGPTMRREPKPC